MHEFSIGLIKKGIGVVSSRWKPYSHLILVNDSNGWSLDWDILELRQIATHLGIQTEERMWRFATCPQAVHFASAQAISNNEKWLELPHRISFSYPQGVPLDPEANPDPVIEALRRLHTRIDRVQVSHSAMRKFVLQTGIDPQKVHQIPIGINLSYFRFRDASLRQKQRRQLGITENAFVVGSFQKDGTGWGEGLEPKMVKGPDILLKTLETLQTSIPELFVLLVGPARGYVTAGLDRLKIPYRDVGRQPYQQVASLFQALDLYLVTSRQEGGPKAVLESMASGIPLVTTRVGQAMDLVKHGENGWMVDIEDFDGLAKWAGYVYQNQGGKLDPILQNGRATAETNSYLAQIPLWRTFMKGFVEWQE